MCPVALSLLPVKRGIAVFLLGVLGAGASVVLICLLAWKVDSAGSKFDVQRLSHVGAAEVTGLDPSIKAEFARSWLEGRFPEDPAIRKRRRIKNRS